MTSADSADGSWLINAMGLTPNVVNGIVELGGEGALQKLYNLSPVVQHRLS